MSAIDDIAEDYVERTILLDPLWATSTGVAGHDHELADLSADGFAERAELDRTTLAALQSADTFGLRDQVALAAMRERLTLEVERYDAGDTTSELNVAASWVQWVRQAFELMPTEGEEAIADVAKRMAMVPRAYRQLSETLLGAARNGHVAARRQVEEVARLCDGWARPGDSYYVGLAQRLTGVPDSLRGELDAAARAADAATAGLGAFLRRELLPLAREQDACGPEIYARAARYWLGATVDLAEAYAWSWEEIARLRAEQARIANLIQPGATAQQAVAILDADPARRIEGSENFRAWMQDLAERAVGELQGTHFDIPEPARRIEAVIAPTHDGGVYYTGPSEDWSRPGRMWWSVPDGLETFATWKEVTTVHHEGVPGHHLQKSHELAERENLNRWQRLMCWVAGHSEGWAVYGERLMAELGFLDDPGAHFGMLDLQLLYTAQLALDIGLHLKLEIPDGTGWREGERWNTDIAWEFLQAHSSLEPDRLRFSQHHYLGCPARALPYKLGERIWLEAREESRKRTGAAFSLKDFHTKALSLGSLGLDPLRETLARI